MSDGKERETISFLRNVTATLFASRLVSETKIGYDMLTRAYNETTLRIIGIDAFSINATRIGNKTNKTKHTFGLLFKRSGKFIFFYRPRYLFTLMFQYWIPSCYFRQ